MIDFGYAVAFVLCMWLHRHGRVCRAWSQVLFGIWLLNELGVYVLGPQLRLLTGLWSDFILALVALYAFTFGRAPWWVLALALTWIAQIFTHMTFDDDIPTMGLVLNVLCAAQIGLVCCERPTRASRRWYERESRSHGRVAAASRYSTRALGGPDCRAGALRRAAQRLEGRMP